MPTEITVPRLGWSMEEAVFSAWLKREGELVRAGEMLFSIESDKATQEVESFDGGVLHLPATAPKNGDTVIVGQVIGYLLATGEKPPADGAPWQAGGARPAIGAASDLSSVIQRPVIAAARPQAAISTPRARRVAGELGVNWPTLTGSGRGGRIREADVRAAAAVRQGDPASGVRSSAARGAAQVTLASLHTTADVSALVRLHGDLVAVDRLVGLRLCGFEDIILKFAAAALRRHPVLNSYWNGPNWVVSPDIHISLAVAMEDHFIHPVVHDADALSLRDLANRSRDLIARAHSRQLAEADLAGGTFTVCNLGAFGIDAFTPTPHPPQCAALGIGRVVRQPAGTGDAAPRDIITLSLTFDPRAFDAAPAARFLQTLAGLIESPLAALLSH